MGKNSEKNLDNPFAALKIKTANAKDDRTPQKNMFTNKNKPQLTVNTDDDSLFFAHMSNVKKIDVVTSPKKHIKQKTSVKSEYFEEDIELSTEKSTEENTFKNVCNVSKTNNASDITTNQNTKNHPTTMSVNENLNIVNKNDMITSDYTNDVINEQKNLRIPNAFLQAFSDTSNEKAKKSQAKKNIYTHEQHKEKNTTTTVRADENELRAFYDATADVKLLSNKNRTLEPQRIFLPQTVPPPVNPLQNFLDAKTEFALYSTNEYVEAHVVGLDLMTVGKLQNRQYSPEAHIDLHGLNSEQAWKNLVVFFRTSYQRGHRMVLVVTGKGNNSINNTPILRTKVQEWFTKDPFKRAILAFCTAKQEDGGAGALYVLIRKQKKDYGKIVWEMTPTDPDFFL